MDLIETLPWIHDFDPKLFPVASILGIYTKCMEKYFDKSPSEDLKIKNPYANTEVSGIDQDMLDYIISGMSICERCDRCSKRTNVSLPTGKVDSKIFILTDYPEKIDDRTGFPLSTSSKLKDSRCITCTGFESCYPFLDWQIDPKPECNYQMDLSNEVKRKLSNEVLFNAPGDLINTNSAYVTHVIKCYGEEITENQVSICKEWLSLERSLVRAKYTLFLGEETARYIFGPKKKLTLNNTFTVKTDICWGDCVIIEHPRDVIGTDREKEYVQNLVDYFDFIHSEGE